MVEGMENTILVTGGAGFIGSNFILQWMKRESSPLLNLDKLTYAGNCAISCRWPPIRDTASYRGTFATGNWSAISCNCGDLEPSYISPRKATWTAPLRAGAISFAPTSTERSAFLEETRRMGRTLPDAGRGGNSAFLTFRPTKYTVLLGLDDPPFSGRHPCTHRQFVLLPPRPLLTTWCGVHHTYGLPTLTTNCSNNYGRSSFREIDPADDSERPRRQAASSLRRRSERARLGVCSRPLRCGDDGPDSGGLAKLITSAVGTRKKIWRS